MAESAILAVAALVGAALVVGALASLPGCTAAERQRAEDTAVAVGVTAADCGVAGAITCAVDVLQACVLPSVADGQSWFDAWQCMQSEGKACAEARGLACGLLALQAVGQRSAALIVEGGQLPAADRAVTAKREAEACIASPGFRAACTDRATCAAALRACLEAALQPDT